MRSMKVAGCACVMLGWLAACGGHEARPTTAPTAQGASSGSSASGTTPNADIAIVPLRLITRETGTALPVVEVHTDGSVVANGLEAARIVGNRVVSHGGTVMLEVSADGHAVVHGGGEDFPLQITDDGRLTAGPRTLVVNPDGTVDAIDGSAPPSRAPFVFEGLRAGDRRTAAVILAVLFATVREASVEPPHADASSSPAAGSSGSPVVGTIAVGQTVTGSLEEGDRVLTEEGGHLADDFTVMLTAGAPVQIDTTGGASTTSPGNPLDVVTALICQGTEVARDDDGGGNLNSRIQYTPTATGACTIRVTGFGGDRGAYTLQVASRAVEGPAAVHPGPTPAHGTPRRRAPTHH